MVVVGYDRISEVQATAERTRKTLSEQLAEVTGQVGTLTSAAHAAEHATASARVTLANEFQCELKALQVRQSLIIVIGDVVFRQSDDLFMERRSSMKRELEK